MTLILPFLLIFKPKKPILVFIVSASVMIGGFIGKYIFGGSANPLSNRFGIDLEKYEFYDIAGTFNYSPPHFWEILIVIGSFGICLVVYKLCDSLLSISKTRDHH